jgi:UPF0716 protein FxsA
MGMLLRLALLALPIAEIALLIAVGQEIGVLPTLALVVAGFLVGSWLIRNRSLAVLQRVRAGLEHGETPVPELIETATVILAGILFMIPGFITDLLALLLLLPATRHAVQRFITGQVMRSGTRRGTATIIETEWREVREDAPTLPGPGPGTPSRWGRGR